MKTLRIFLFLLAAASARGQPANTVVSPEVQPDRTATFRLYAPKAMDVSLTGDWVTGPQKMTAGADGVWSVTLGPLPPSTYIYSFTVDGVAMADPVNPRMKLRARGSGSLVEIPAPSLALDEVRNVPHGTVEINWEKSTVLNGENRAIWVYTPPGYDAQSGRHYPVLYLLHGSNDTAAGWTTVGNVNFILDNLLAEKKAVPMVIVMPFGHAVPYGVRGGGGGPGGAAGATPPAATSRNTLLFEQYLLQDVMPFVEAKYRLRPGRENRALAGMSMGGEQALYIFFTRFDTFSSVAALSASFRALETQYPALLNDAAGTNARISVLWIGCGREDAGAFAGSTRIDEVLTAHQIHHIWRPATGVHNYALWRQEIAEVLPLLFRQDAVVVPPTFDYLRSAGKTN